MSRTTTTDDPTSAAVEHRGASMATLVGVELRKSVDTRAGRWLLMVLGALVLLALVAAVWATDRADWGFTGFLTIATIPLLLLLPVLGVLLVSSEFSQRTALLTLTLVPSRTRFVVSKLLAAVVLALVATALLFVLTAAATGAAAAVEPGTSWSVEPVVLLQMTVGLVVWLLVGAAFGLAFQNTPAAVVTYLVLPSILFPLQSLFPGIAEAVGWLDLGTAGAPLLDAATMTSGQWARVGTAAAVWFGIPLLVGWARLQRREIS